MFLVGLTGGIASGKSTVSAMLEKKGACIIDADRIGHEVIKKGREGYRELVREFGEGIVGSDGEIERPRLAATVFGDPEKVSRLNAITHPLITREIISRIEQCRNEKGEGGIAVLDAALLLEAGGRGLVDMLVVVAAPVALQVDRLRKDRGMAEEEASARISAQSSLEEKKKQADWVVENSGSIEDLEAGVEELWREILRRSASSDRGQPQ
jgi:dephospho-CoA kinase